MVSNATVKSRALLVKTFVGKLHTLQHGAQADLYFTPNFLNLFDSMLKKRRCLAERNIRIEKQRKSTNISKVRKRTI